MFFYLLLLLSRSEELMLLLLLYVSMCYSWCYFLVLLLRLLNEGKYVSLCVSVYETWVTFKFSKNATIVTLLELSKCCVVYGYELGSFRFFPPKNKYRLRWRNKKLEFWKYAASTFFLFSPGRWILCILLSTECELEKCSFYL